MTLKLGDKVKDTITGFTGIAVAKTEWLHSCTRISIEPDFLDKDGKPVQMEHFDEQRVVLVERLPVPQSADAPTTRPGGPRPSPQRAADPTR